jgi:hypothetical protein
MLALYFAWYNFVRVHQCLRVVPAMEPGITGHAWEVDGASFCLTPTRRPYRDRLSPGLRSAIVLFFKWEAPMFDSVLPAESEPMSVVSSRWLWAVRCFALIYAISLVGEYVAAAHFDPLSVPFMFLSTFGLRSLLSLVLLYLLFRSGEKSRAFALGLGAVTAFVAVFGVASNALFWPLGRTFNLVIAWVIFSPVTPPFFVMTHQPDPRLATEGLLLLWSFGICSAMLGLSSVVAFRKMTHEAQGMGGLRFAFRAGLCCPLVAWLIGMLSVLPLLFFHM